MHGRDHHAHQPVGQREQPAGAMVRVFRQMQPQRFDQQRLCQVIGNERAARQQLHAALLASARIWTTVQHRRFARFFPTHRKTMPYLAEWADEASVGHWSQPGCDLPEWPDAVRRLRAEERPVTLRHPGPNHREQRFSETHMTHGMRL